MSEEELVGMMGRANDAADGVFEDYWSEFPAPESELMMGLADDVLTLVAEVKRLRAREDDSAIERAERDYGEVE